MSTHLERVIEDLVTETKRTNDLLQEFLTKKEEEPKKKVAPKKKEV